jgi:HEAT repeat protein
MRLITGATILLLLLGGVSVGQEPEDPTLEQTLAEAATWQWGDDPAGLERIKAAVLAAQGDLEERNRVANALAETLGGDGSEAFKLFVCRHLYLIATEDQAPLIAPLLQNDETITLARFALEKIPGDVVDQAFVDALKTAKGEAKQGIIGSIGKRGIEAAVPDLLALARAGNVEQPKPEELLDAYAAVDALAEIGGQRMVNPLSTIYDEATARMKPKLLEAALRIAEGMLDDEDEYARNLAAAIHDSFYNIQPDLPDKIAGLRGYTLRADRDKATEAVVQWLDEQRPEFHAYVMPYVVSMPDKEITTAFLDRLDGLTDSSRAQLLRALGERGDVDALPKAEVYLSDENPEVQQAAIAAVGALGGRGVVAELLALTQAEEATVADAAREALASLTGEGVNDALIAQLEADEESAEQMVIIDILQARVAHDTVPALSATARAADTPVATHAAAAIGELATADQSTALIQLVEDAPNAEVREAAARALASAVRRLGVRVDAPGLLKAIEETESADARAALIPVLGSLDSAEALAMLEGYAKDKSQEDALRMAAIEELGNTDTASPAATLGTLAREAGNEAISDAAFGAWVRLLNQTSDMENAEKLSDYKAALELADSPAEKRLILAGLSSMRDEKALDLVLPLAEDAELARDAQVAAEKIRSNFYELSASHGQADVRKAFDAQIDTRWTTGATQHPGQWFQIDLSRPASVAGVVLDTTRSKDDYPRGYEVYVFDDPENMGKPVAAGTDAKPVFKIEWPAVTGRYLRIVQTGTADQYYWSIHELQVVPG